MMPILNRLLVFAVFMFGIVGVSAQETAAENTFIDASLELPLGPGSFSRAVYGELKNITASELSVEVESCQFFTMVMLHETVQSDGKLAMRHRDSLLIKPGESAVLQRGGLHLMLMKQQQTLKIGDSITCRFEIEMAETKHLVNLPVRVSSLIKPEEG